MNELSELHGLEPAAFEHLINALAIRVLGAGATGFGPGADGGRDGYFEGQAPYPSAELRWDGTWYIQSKFHALNLSKDPQKWLLEQVREELKAFSEADSERRWPDNWILATNIDPSGVPETGAFDQARKLVMRARPELARRFHIWGGRKVLNLLGEHVLVGRRFAHFLTPGHAISALIDALDDERASITDILQCLVVRAIEDQRNAKLEQAGSSEDQRPGIDDLFVDLPFVEASGRTSGLAMSALSSAAACNHKLEDCDTAGEEWSDWRSQPCRASVWFLRAGPGRGKSSISQFFCQVHRAALVLQAEGLAVHPTILSLAQRIERKARALNCWPTAPRIPLWVELKSYASWFGNVAKGNPKGVATYLCSQLRKEAETEVPVKTLKRALKTRSWVVVFDGLDEVPSDVKDAIAFEIVNFTRDMSVVSDIFSICTSRPQGYAGQFDALKGAVVDLVDLPPEIALECATKVVAIDRSLGDAAGAISLLEQAMSSPAARDLMTTPLQAHIMAVLVRNGQRPPERKWDLYLKFYEVIRDREANRDLPDSRLRDLFQRDPDLIDAVHQRLGIALHTKAEKVSGADASLTKAEFRALVRKVVGETRSSDDVEPIVDALVLATTERLVLISTPDLGDRVRFDIRAIQEFFAAEFIYTDTRAEVLRERLELIVRDAHWREVVQFVLGALSSNKRATEWSVALDTLRSLDAGESESLPFRLARYIAGGAFHAALFLDNGGAENSLKTREQIRGLLDPLAEQAEGSLIGPLMRISSPQTSDWLRSWAIEQARRLRETESAGALRILTALVSNTGRGVSEALDLLDSMPAGIVGDLLQELSVRFGTQAELDSAVWLRDAQTRFLKRDDCGKAAPRFVSLVLAESTGRSTPKQATRAAGKFHRIRMPLSEEATNLATSYVTWTRISIDGAEIVRPELAQRFRNRAPAPPAGLGRWLELVSHMAKRPTSNGTKEALSWLGQSWAITEALPVELTSFLPIPKDPRHSPAVMAAHVHNLSDAELSKCLASHELEGIPLSPQIDRGWLASFSSKATVPIDNLAQTYPRSAWVVWCVSDFGLDEGAPSGIGPENRRIVRRMLERDPFAIDALPGAELNGLAKLQEELGPACAALVGVDYRWQLRFGRYRSDDKDLSGLSKALCHDVRFLPLLASAAIGTLAPEWQSGRTVPWRPSRLTPLDSRALLAIARNPGHRLHERAAAALLAVAAAVDGWSILLEAAEDLLDLARSGVPVAGATAALIESLGQATSSAAHNIIGNLLDARIAGREAPSSALSDDNLLSSVFEVWRERSSAPMTRADAISQWTGV